MPIEEIKQKITPLLKLHGVTRAAIFGSVARGEDTAKSDVDILVELKRPYGLIRFITLKHSLEDVLNKKVDLVEYEAIRPAFAETILRDATKIYEG